MRDQATLPESHGSPPDASGRTGGHERPASCGHALAGGSAARTESGKSPGRAGSRGSCSTCAGGSVPEKRPPVPPWGPAAWHSLAQPVVLGRKPPPAVPLVQDHQPAVHRVEQLQGLPFGTLCGREREREAAASGPALRMHLAAGREQCGLAETHPQSRPRSS